SSLASVTLGTNVSIIGTNAFRECYSLTNILLPAALTHLGQGAFESCGRLTAINVAPLNQVYSSLDGVVFDKSQQTLLLCPAGRQGTYTVPAGVTRVADFAFGYSMLTTIALPNSLTAIGKDSFYQCYIRTI